MKSPNCWVLAGCVFCCGALAHDRATDGDDADWLLPGPTLSNMAHVVRDADGHGSLVWRDAPGDAQTALNDPEREADLTELRISGSPERLHVLARFTDLSRSSGSGTVQIQLALDMDRVEGSGNLAFGGGADLQVTLDAGWEFLVSTRFGSGAGTLSVESSAGGSQTAGEAVIDTVADLVELSLPWSALGLSAPPQTPVGVSTALFLSADDDGLLEVGGSTESDAFDVVTHNNQPGVARPSADELGDQTLNHHLELWFTGEGEVRAPLLISALQSRPAGMIAGEFIRLVNPGSTVIDLAGYAIGDEETPGATEGMFALPSFALSPEQQVTIARSAFAYSAAGETADFETEMSQPEVTSLAPDTVWAIGGLELVDSGDQVIVLDPHRTVIDAVAYGSAFYVGVESLAESGGGQTHQRAPRSRDRNLEDDFRFEVTDLGIEISRTPQRVISGALVQYRIRVFSDGPDAVLDGPLRVEQFDGLTFERSECLSASPGAVCQALDGQALDALVSLGTGQEMEILLEARAGAAGDAFVSARILPQDSVGELLASDNFDADQQTIEPDELFRDGFESP